MDFNLEPNVELVAESAKSFAEKFIRPNVMDWDESQYFPKELLKQAGEFGLWVYWSLSRLEVLD